MKKITIIMFFLAAIIPLVSAQPKVSVLQRVNEIKSSSDYLWDQYTHTDIDTSRVGAANRLILHIESFLEKEGEVTVDNILQNAEFVNINRGNLKQCFAYIKKTDVLKMTNASPVVEEKVEPEPIRERNMGFVPDAFTMRIKETNDFMTVYKLLKSLQAQGEILQFGKLKDVDDYSSFDLILFNMSSQEVITLLSQETSPGVRKNMITGLDDSLKNYDTGTTAVIWYVK